MKIKSIIAKALLIMSLFAVLPFVFFNIIMRMHREKRFWIWKKKSPISRMK